MALLGSFTKQPREILDYDLDYSLVLQGRPDTLNTVTSEVSPVGLTVTYAQISGSNVKVVVSGGSNGILYKVTTLTTTTPAGLKYEDEVNILVEDV